MRPDNDTDYWRRKYGPDHTDEIVERQRFLAEEADVERDWAEEAYNADLGHDEDDDVDDAKIARYDERG